MAIGSDAFSLRGHHAVLDAGELQLEFSKRRVFDRVWSRVFRKEVRIVKPCSHLAGEKESPADADGADGIQFICIEKDLGFQGLGLASATVSVRLDAVADVVLFFLGERIRSQNRFRDFHPFFRVTEGSPGFILVGPSCIMKPCSDSKKFFVGFFRFGELHAEFVDPLCVVPVVAAPSRGKARLRKSHDVVQGADRCGAVC